MTPRTESRLAWIERHMWPQLIWIAFCFLLAGVLNGCSAQTPPDFISIDSEFTEAEHATILDAVSSWCDAVGWCPAEASWSDRGRFQLAGHLGDPGGGPPGRPRALPCPPGATCEVEGHNDGDTVRILREGEAHSTLDLDRLWIIVAHEAGHFCKHGHTATGLMSAVHNPGEPLVIDDVAIAAWRGGCE